MEENTKDWMEMASDEVGEVYREPKSLGEFVDDELEEHPYGAAQSPLYILSAIEHYGTRKVIEEGEEKERYRFFDDPANDGEHAVLGNTEVLNELVDDLKNIAAGRGKDDKMIWVEGPTATGKSELKRCMINMLEAYSREEEPRYTIEWNREGSSSSSSGIGFDTRPGQGDEYQDSDSTKWDTSPVKANPLTVLPKEARKQVLDDLNSKRDSAIDIAVEGDLDPFSQEIYDELVHRYRHEKGVDEADLFEKVTDEGHFRVRNYIMKEGDGIGVLYSDDDGRPKQKLVGDWIRELIGKPDLDSRGGRDARAFGYDGVISQGNGGLTIIEDASEHAKTLKSLLNVPEEKSIRLDKGVKMDVDTLFMLISNPDLEATLKQNVDQGNFDPLKAMRRRLDKREFKYLTSYSLEAELLRREIAEEYERWDGEKDDDRQEKIMSSLVLPVKEDGEVVEKEIAPHGVEAAAVYNIATRLKTGENKLSKEAVKETGLEQSRPNLLDKVMLYDQGFVRYGDERFTKEDFELKGTEHDGKIGMPVTVARDAISGIVNKEFGRSHEELDVENVVMPKEILERITEEIADEEIFAEKEKKAFRSLSNDIRQYVTERQEEDVLDALLKEFEVSDDELETYIDNVEAEVMGENVETGSGEKKPDDAFMKEFEIEKLGKFTESRYRGAIPHEDAEVYDFRDRIKNEMDKRAREKGGSLEIDDIRDLPVLDDILGNNTWADVDRHYDNFDVFDWEDPPATTRLDAGESMQEIKEKTLENMVDMGYSEASAFLTAEKIMKRQKEFLKARKGLGGS